MGLSVFGFEQAPSWGWSNPGTWVCIIGGLAVLAVFVRFEFGRPYPLIRMEVFRNRAFMVDNGVLFFSMIAFVPVFFFAAVYSQVSLGYNANKAGLYLLVFFAGFAPAAQVGGNMLDKGGARRPVVLGSALGTVGFALWAWKITDLSLGAQWIYIVLAGAGIGLLLGPASTDAVNRAIGASYGEVTGITQTVRNYASTLGIAVLGTVLSTILSNRLDVVLRGPAHPRPHRRPDRQRHQRREVGRVRLGTGGDPRPGDRRAADGLRVCHPRSADRDGHRARVVVPRGAAAPGPAGT